MDKILIAIFENEPSACSVLESFNELQSKDYLILFTSTIIHINEKGKLEFKITVHEGHPGLAAGLFAGNLINLFRKYQGPLTKNSISNQTEKNCDDSETEFINEITSAILIGQTVIIAELDEKWNVPVDTTLHEANAIDFRRMKFEMMDDQLSHESKCMTNEFELIKDHQVDVGSKKRSKIKSSIEKLETKENLLRIRLGINPRKLRVNLNKK